MRGRINAKFLNLQGAEGPNDSITCLLLIERPGVILFPNRALAIAYRATYCYTGNVMVRVSDTTS